MDFASVILFMVVYYVRPHEWIKWVATIQPVTVVTGLAILSMLLRYRGFTVRDFFKTTHDRLMMVYFIWMVFTSPAHFDTLKGVYPLFVFYIVTVQSLSKIERVQSFLNWWTLMILVVGVMAVASEYGFDPTGSYDITHRQMKGRLALNTSLFDNPNALGHSIYPVILMLYFVLFWKRPVFMKIFCLAIIPLPIYCVFLTVSKGAFVAGFAAIVCALTFGRPKPIQILILVLALTFGIAGVKSLPRMQELEKAQTDEAIGGRLAVFKFGRASMREHPMGIGWWRFPFEFAKSQNYRIMKNAHSTYVQVGTELGYIGLYLYLAILYCCLRTLITARTTDVREERVRRILFVVLVSYALSGWMVTFTYRATFFLMAGAIAAYHRQLFDKNKLPQPTATATDSGPPLLGTLPAWTPAPVASPALAMSALEPPGLPVRSSGFGVAAAETQTEPGGLRWNQLKWLDWLMVLALTYATLLFWEYIMINI